MALTLPQTVHSSSALVAIRLGSAIDSVSRWEQMSTGRWSIKRPKKKKPGFSSSGRRTNILSMSSEGLWSVRTRILESLIPQEITGSVHLDKAGSQGCIGICSWITDQIYEADGNVPGKGMQHSDETWLERLSQAWSRTEPQPGGTIPRGSLSRRWGAWWTPWWGITDRQGVKIPHLWSTSLLTLKRTLYCRNLTLVFEYEKSRDSVETNFGRVDERI